MRAELLAVGDELLYGDIVNGNAAWLGQQLADAGVRLSRSVVVGDEIEVIAEAIRVALDRADAVLLTGGLGPTQDDLTREALALAAGVEMRRDDFLEAQLRRRFAQLSRNAPDRNFRQADLPVGAESLPNARGTAPGVRMPLLGGVAYALPGVPHEMYAMFTESVLPDLLKRAGRPAVVVHRVLRTAGMWESAVAEAMAPEVDRLQAQSQHAYGATPNPSIAFLASGGQTRVRITAHASDRAEAEELIAPTERFARDALGAGLYGSDDESLEGVIHRMLGGRGQTVATAESLTGGLVAARLTETPGASATFRGGEVVYATDLKATLLGADVYTYGAVSPQTAAALAEGVRSRLGATWGLATTGVAGPDEQEGQPVGTLHIGLAGPDGTVTRALRVPAADRAHVRMLSVVQALDVLRRSLAGLLASS
ncbi:MAG TPA: competence/damage-inducible protein A [Frankiaceae bacterium]|nr:competence/damage-inducible protein A [Frankiaceae bacterium]